MTYAEAIEWLLGKRSAINSIPVEPAATFSERVARADAAMTEQAYWIARANRENVI